MATFFFINNTLYPKAGTPFMARTDFHSMWKTLPPEEKAGWEQFTKREQHSLKDNQPVFPKGFSDAEEKPAHYKGPTIKDWFASISGPTEYPLHKLDRQTIEGRALDDIFDLIHQTCKDEEVSSKISSRKIKQQSRNIAVPVWEKLQKREMVDDLNALEVFFRLLTNGDGKKATLENILGDMNQAFKETQAKDLMPRGEVTEANSSMGAMTVPISGPEKERAILEFRALARVPQSKSFKEETPLSKNMLEVFAELDQFILQVKKSQTGEQVKKVEEKG